MSAAEAAAEARERAAARAARAEYLEHAKKKAIALAQRGDLKGAVVSMMNDLSGHPETKCTVFDTAVAMIYIRDKDVDGVKRWIEAFD